MSKLKKPIKYDRVIQELEKEYLILMTKYLSKLHDAFHEDNGSEASHEDLVNKIKQDGMSIFSNNLEELHLTTAQKNKSSKKSWNTILT